MASLTIIYWQDIPSQVTIKSTHRTVKRQLSERFQKVIDESAMISNSTDSESYLDKWHKSAPISCSEELEVELETMINKIENEYTDDKLKMISKTNKHNKKISKQIL